MTDQHPITLSTKLIQQWLGEYFGTTVTGEISDVEHALATRAYRAGADQELKACCELLDINGCPGKWIDMLRAARRPVPPNLAEAALDAQSRMWAGTSTHDDWELVRRALERLQELEEQADG